MAWGRWPASHMKLGLQKEDVSRLRAAWESRVPQNWMHQSLGDSL